MQARRTLTPGQKGTKKFIEVKLAGSKWNTAKLVSVVPKLARVACKV